MRRTTLSIVAVAFLLALAGACAPASGAGEESTVQSTITLRVEGMTCGSCPVAVRTALRKLDGVRDATLSLDDKTAVVRYDPARVAPEAMVAAIAAIGFTAAAAP